MPWPEAYEGEKEEIFWSLYQKTLIEFMYNFLYLCLINSREVFLNSGCLIILTQGRTIY
jgi:hypothetical protein